MLIDTDEVVNRIENFINARTVHINGKRYLPVDDSTVHRLMIDLTMPDSEYNSSDDFRSRA
jgi:hypothetical protein